MSSGTKRVRESHALLRALQTFTALVALTGCASWQMDRTSELNRDGVDALNHNDLNQAYARFVESWKLQPHNADTLYNLATTYHRHGEYPVAERYYQQALQVNPDHSTCRHNYHLLLVSENRTAVALADATRWKELKPRSPEALAEVGWLNRLGGDLPTARTHLEQALALDPNSTLASLELGKVYEAYQMPDRARSLFQRVTAQDPNNTEAKELLTSLSRSPSAGPTR